MKCFRLFVIALILAMLFSACGKAGEESGAIETNDIRVVFSDGEQFSPGSFELKKTLGFISGMRYNARSTAKHVYVAFANYDAELGFFAVDVPKEPGQIVIVISFKTENRAMPLNQQMDAYAKMKVPTGTYPPGWMIEGRCFQVNYFVGGQEGGPSISGQGASGSATLTTSTSDRVSGRIDFTSPGGSTIRGTFNVRIEKDLWKK
jgi:hypothetical protein